MVIPVSVQDEANKIIDAINKDRWLRRTIERIVLREREDCCFIEAHIKQTGYTIRVSFTLMKKLNDIANIDGLPNTISRNFELLLDEKYFQLYLSYPPPDKIPVEKL